MSTETPEPDEKTKRQERVWLSAGALVGVVVAGLAVAIVVLTGKGGGSNPAAPPLSSTTAAPPVGTGQALASARDESLKAAEDAVVVLNTLDYHSAASDLTHQESVATAPLLDELKARHDATAANAEKAKTVSTAKVLAAAVSKIAQDNSSAEVLVSVEVTVTDPKGPNVKQLRQKLTMLHTGEGWKTSALATVEPG